MHYLPHTEQVRRMTTEELRSSFLVTELFHPGVITLRAIDLDRVVLGGIVPTDEPLQLGAPEALAAEYFTERREAGVLNIGGPGRATVDGEPFTLENRDVLYIGRGSRDITFESDDPANPARLYLVSYPAHAAHPTRRIARDEADATELGSVAQANQRRLSKYIHPDAGPSAQLVMGVTELKEGSVWNTMPVHTHQRRTEVYLYFDLPEDAVVFHFVGEPTEIRAVVTRSEEVALSPSWSIHSGCGTGSYSFCWAMGGENQAFSDMQGVAMPNLR
jgi:4-deoxy-L-threo-5-hexosulose-uronate ketol-isomerase